MIRYKNSILLIIACTLIAAIPAQAEQPVATFSIVAGDPETGELGVAVASKFFAVGSVVPWAKAGVGAVATQSYANTTFGWRGLELMEQGMTPEEALAQLIESDNEPGKRQVGIVDAAGNSVTYTGDKCNAWAGGVRGPNYAIQGNILTGEDVVTSMEQAFLETEGTLADRLYAALLAGDAKGGDSRGKQSAAMLVVKDKAGYGGYTDRAIDIRVDDHTEPFIELGRLLQIAQVNYAWNEAWTYFTEEKFAEALPPMMLAAKLDPDYAEVLYDLAVIQLANDMTGEALESLTKSFGYNPDLKAMAKGDNDLKALHDNPEFMELVK